MSIVLRYTHPDRLAGTIEVQPVTTARYIAKRIADDLGCSDVIPWTLVKVDGPLRYGKHFNATVINDNEIAADLDADALYTVAEVSS